MNYFKTFLLMTALLALFMIVGNSIGGTQGMAGFFVMGLIMNFISYWFSDSIILKMSGAKRVSENELPQVYKIVRSLAAKAGMPMPKIYLMDNPMLNAFATGRNPDHAAVAVTSGILAALDENELTGVLGHELSHVKNRDILIATVAAAVAGFIMMLSRTAMFFGYRGNDNESRSNGLSVLALAVLAPIAATVIQMAISRSREYAADESGARLTHSPLSLASALHKLSAVNSRRPSNVNPATAHLYIVSPFAGQSLLSLFSTHPPIPDRIKRLEDLAIQIPKEDAGGNLPRIVY